MNFMTTSNNNNSSNSIPRLTLGPKPKDKDMDAFLKGESVKTEEPKKKEKKIATSNQVIWKNKEEREEVEKGFEAHINKEDDEEKILNINDFLRIAAVEKARRNIAQKARIEEMLKNSN